MYGNAPPGDDFLVIGHESFGIVEEVGPQCDFVREALGGERVAMLITHPQDKAAKLSEVLRNEGVQSLSSPDGQVYGSTVLEVLKKAGAKDVTYMRIKGAGHGVFNQHAKQTKPAMEEFFGRVLKEK